MLINNKRHGNAVAKAPPVFLSRLVSQVDLGHKPQEYYCSPVEWGWVFYGHQVPKHSGGGLLNKRSL